MMAALRRSVRIREKRRNAEDQISSLPDELLHKILTSTDTVSAIQTSVLSKRWENVWKSLPILCFDDYFCPKRDKFTELVKHALSNRNDEDNFEKFTLTCQASVIRDSLVEFVTSAIRKNVQEIEVSSYSKLSHLMLSCFSSTCLKRLKLVMYEDFDDTERKDLPSWSLPALQSLHLFACSLPQSCFDLPALSNLYMRRCKLPKETWHLPALVSLELRSVQFTENRSDYFSELVNLENLVLHFLDLPEEVFKIACGKLVNLKISCYRGLFGKFVVSSPKLENFEYAGAVPITIATNGLNKANVRIKCPVRSLQLLPVMFQGLRSVKFLVLDEGAIEALSAVSDVLEYQPSPFCNLKYVKIPETFPVSTVPSAVKTYLLGHSPSTIIVTEFPQAEQDI